MTPRRLRSDWPTKPARCALCRSCHVITAGPHHGQCPYGGPFIGYQRYENGAYGPVFREK